MPLETLLPLEPHPARQPVKVWDLGVRLFHWALVACIAANVFVTNPEKSLHHRIGYAVLGLVAFRLVWGLVGPRYARFSSFRPSASAALEQLSDMVRGRRRVHVGHSPLGTLMIWNLLVTLIAIGLSGWMQTTDAFWGVKWVKELHEICVTWVEVSVAAHVAAVIFESRRLGLNLAAAMVTGYKDLPEEPGQPAE